MQSIFVPIPPRAEDGDPGIFVQGVHEPMELTKKSGVWIHSAGSAMLVQNAYAIASLDQRLWLIVDEGRVTFEHGSSRYALRCGECLVLPPNTANCVLTDAKDARILWMTLDGALCPDFMRHMNAQNRLPARQGILPTQILLVRQIVQVLVRHTDTGDTSFQLAQLLWGMLAAHSGQSVAMAATLSHEITRVVDSLRASHYQSNYSLAEMAIISRMPVETFRKRFSTELGIPPLGYLQFLKMERAKTLLRRGLNVRQTGVEIGMPDPYHFSKQFKHVVGMSPTGYLKHIGGCDEPFE